MKTQNKINSKRQKNQVNTPQNQLKKLNKLKQDKNFYANKFFKCKQLIEDLNKQSQNIYPLFIYNNRIYYSDFFSLLDQIFNNINSITQFLYDTMKYFENISDKQTAHKIEQIDLLFLHLFDKTKKIEL